MDNNFFLIYILVCSVFSLISITLYIIFKKKLSIVIPKQISSLSILISCFIPIYNILFFISLIYLSCMKKSILIGVKCKKIIKNEYSDECIDKIIDELMVAVKEEKELQKNKNEKKNRE